MTPLTPAAFQAATGVSRETMARLQAYADLLAKWNRRINLVGPRTLPDLWRRHMLDSAQLYPLLPDPAASLLDLGSGAGFPGLVLSIMGAAEVTLVESDRRKAAFLGEAVRIAGSAARIANVRLEALPRCAPAAITARAFAPVPALLRAAAAQIGPETVLLLPKGRHVEEELTEAARYWRMSVTRSVSLSDPSGVVLRLTGLEAREAQRGP